MQWITTAGISVVLLALSGCVTTPQGPGPVPADTPPKLIQKGENPIWNDPGLFGPVPSEQQARGNEICRSANYRHAIGYHPEARDIDGRRLPNGGFLCEGELGPDAS